MDELQFRPAEQGSGLFGQLFRYLVAVLPGEIKYAEADALKDNHKVQAVLGHLGLAAVRESQNGRSLHFRGEYKTLMELYGNE